VAEWTNGNFPAKNTVEQLLALYTDPESHKQTDGQTDDMMMMPTVDHRILFISTIG